MNGSQENKNLFQLRKPMLCPLNKRYNFFRGGGANLLLLLEGTFVNTGLRIIRGCAKKNRMSVCVSESVFVRDAHTRKKRQRERKRDLSAKLLFPMCFGSHTRAGENLIDVYGVESRGGDDDKKDDLVHEYCTYYTVYTVVCAARAICSTSCDICRADAYVVCLKNYSKFLSKNGVGRNCRSTGLRLGVSF